MPVDGAAPILIPEHLRPTDGRFGSGPTRIRQAQSQALAAAWQGPLGTSHRQSPVRHLVAQVQEHLHQLFTLPDGYRVVLGNGGASTFWDVATFGLVRERAQHVVFGAFSEKFAAATAAAPFLSAPQILSAPAGRACLPRAEPDVDVYCQPHNETSTGTAIPVHRTGEPDQLMLVDATSAAGALPVDVAEADAYYFSPQKALGSEGGLWFALLSPAALQRAEQLAPQRYIPGSLSLTDAIRNSAAAQTSNTPAVATLLLMEHQLAWILGHGGLDWATASVARSSDHLYGWAQTSDWLHPFVTQEEFRSPTVVTLAVRDGIDAKSVINTLRHNGIVDIDPYRGVGTNLLRIGVFPSVPLADVQALTACLDYVAERVGSS